MISPGRGRRATCRQSRCRGRPALPRQGRLNCSGKVTGPWPSPGDFVPYPGQPGKARLAAGEPAAEETNVNEIAQQEIVVGVSGSRASVAALRWAADEARRRPARLSVVCAWDPFLRRAPYADVSEGHPGDQARAALYSGLATAIRTALGPVPPDGVDTELAEGPPERVLVSRSGTADLLVLGTGRPQDAAGLSVGPVIRSCLSRARCPVVVVSASLDQDAGRWPDPATAAPVSALIG